MPNLKHVMLNNITASNIETTYSEDSPIDYPLYVMLYNRISEAFRNSRRVVPAAVIDTKRYGEYVQLSWREHSGRFEIMVRERTVDELLEVFKDRGFEVEVKSDAIIVSWKNTSFSSFRSQSGVNV